MAELKCKICGGSLAVDEDSSVATCEYCGTKQTLPKLSDERRMQMYDRANHFRRNSDYDKAMSVFEQILNEDRTDAEAYWSIVLCRYGVEYVEDPVTHQRKPTVNRTQFASIFADEDYKSAIEYADSMQREIYEADAKSIDNIQKGILEISQKEEPFDVFICYKETDSAGRRTPDSVLANDLYHQLIQEGFKVFFSRITLEDKIGEAYEPYIFAALNSAKVMVVLGTRPEYFKAVWVRNEWSRFLSQIKAGAKKSLVPAYKDMDPYDLPDEFSNLQAQDMSKLGFMQDLIRGIKKLTKPNKNSAQIKETSIINNNSNANINALIDRAMLALEDKEFEKADEFCEQALNQDARNPIAYLAKLMAEYKVSTKKQLGKLPELFDSSKNYEKAIRFGDKNLKDELNGYIDEINQQKEYLRKEAIYNRACSFISNTNIDLNEEAISIFKTIIDFEDSRNRILQCENNIKQIRPYDEACNLISVDNIESNEKAIKIFESIIDFKDSKEKINICEQNINLIKEIPKEKKYQEACSLMSSCILGNRVSDLEEAYSIFEQLINYKDSLIKCEECKNKIKEIEEERIRTEQKRIEEKKEKRKNILISFFAIAFAVIFIVVAYFSIEILEWYRLENLTNEIVNNMIKCPAGKFVMGSPSNELGRNNNEQQHNVVISKPFYISKYEVTQKEFETVTGYNPSFFKGDDRPAESIGWNDAIKFCEILNQYTNNIPHGYKFDLPTEAQWEYACRAGTTSSLNSGKNITSETDNCSNLDEVGWYYGNSDSTTHPVGQKKPNDWGIYDMHGNVWEWCKDRYGNYPSSSVTDPLDSTSGSLRVYRGGSWSNRARFCRSAFRISFPDYGNESLGFRLVLVPIE